jgi:hypothetical protein
MPTLRNNFFENELFMKNRNRLLESYFFLIRDINKRATRDNVQQLNQRKILFLEAFYTSKNQSQHFCQR